MDIRPGALKSPFGGDDASYRPAMSRPKHQTDGDGRLVEAFRQERLDHLRKSIDEGTYHVSTRNVAAAMVRRGIAAVMAKSKSRG
jgi:Anti-sigma-28 factor, FlgM